MDISKYPASGQLAKVTLILRLLFANGATGLAPTEIAKGAKLSGSYVTQQLGQMANAGLVEEVGETGRWRPHTRWAQMAIGLMTSIQRETDSLNEFQQRITRRTT
jgi:DNA-binding IclR family transcriptional regulator